MFIMSKVAKNIATNDAIGAAVLAEFTEFGYQRASIQSIARRAGVSRATVYLRCSGKDELFRALVARLHDEHLAAMRAAAQDQTTDIETRLLRLLHARFFRFVELTTSSQRAAELFDPHGQLCGDIAQDAQRRAAKMMTGVLRRAVAAGELDLGRSGLTIAQLAGVLDDCAYGAISEYRAAVRPAEFVARLTRSVNAVVYGIKAMSQNP
jgi:AcrR family transcriptional regulator